MEGIGGKSLLITSCRPHEGKTITAVNLAVSIAHKVDQTALLVDADLREPCVHRYLDLDVQEGLSDYLLNRGEIPNLLINPGIDRLVVLPSGLPVPNSAELLVSPRMTSFITEAKKRYKDRFIIFDSPCLVWSDAVGFSNFVDAILLVVEAEKTLVEDLRHAAEMLKGRPVIGTVFNKARE